MPAPKDKKRAVALKKVWTLLRRYFAQLTMKPENKDLWNRVEAAVDKKLAEEEGKTPAAPLNGRRPDG